jgi:hypothetical protein
MRKSSEGGIEANIDYQPKIVIVRYLDITVLVASGNIALIDHLRYL